MKLAWIIFSLTLVIAEGRNIPSRPSECDPVHALLVSGILDKQEGREAVGAVVSILPLNSTVTVGDIAGPTYNILIPKFSILKDSDAGNVKASLDKYHFQKSSNVLKSENFEDLVQATFPASDLPEPSNIVFLITGNQVLDRDVRINLPIIYVSFSDPGKDTYQIATDPQHRLAMKQLYTKEVQSLLCEDYRVHNTPKTSVTTTVTPAQEHTNNKNLVTALAVAAFVLLLLIVGILAARKRDRLDQCLQRCKRQNSSEPTQQVAESVPMVERRPTCDNDGNALQTRRE